MGRGGDRSTANRRIDRRHETYTDTLLRGSYYNSLNLIESPKFEQELLFDGKGSSKLDKCAGCRQVSNTPSLNAGYRIDFCAEKQAFANRVPLFNVADFERTIVSFVHFLRRPRCPRDLHVTNLYFKYNVIGEQIIRRLNAI